MAGTRQTATDRSLLGLLVGVGLVLAAACGGSSPGQTASGHPRVDLLFPKDSMTVVDPGWIVWDPNSVTDPDTIVVSIDGEEVARDMAWFGTGHVEFGDRPSGEYAITAEFLDEANETLGVAEVSVRFERFEPGRGAAVLSQRYEDGDLSIDELIMAGMVLMHEADPDADPDDDGGSATGSMLMLMTYLPQASADTQAAFDLMSGAYSIGQEEYEAWESRQPTSIGVP